jgi:hypothetical protein
MVVLMVRSIVDSFGYQALQAQAAVAHAIPGKPERAFVARFGARPPDRRPRRELR